jgi:hypothetical protein
LGAKAALLGFFSLLVLLPAYSQSPERSSYEAEKVAGQLWDKLLTRCGDSYYLYLPFKAGLSDHFEQWQYKGVRFYVVPRSFSSRQETNGVQWEGVAVMSAMSFRSRTAKPGTGAAKDADPKAWGAWRPWGDGFVPSNAFLRDMPQGIGDPPNVIQLRKEKGKWLFRPHESRTSSNDVIGDLDEIARRKPFCADLGNQPPTK